jgi:hypothetical protein
MAPSLSFTRATRIAEVELHMGSMASPSSLRAGMAHLARYCHSGWRLSCQNRRFRRSISLNAKSSRCCCCCCCCCGEPSLVVVVVVVVVAPAPLVLPPAHSSDRACEGEAQYSQAGLLIC